MAKATAREKRSCGIAKLGSPRAELTKEDGSFSVDMEDLTFDAPDCAGLALEVRSPLMSTDCAGLALEAALEAASVEEASGGEGGGEKG